VALVSMLRNVWIFYFTFAVPQKTQNFHKTEIAVFQVGSCHIMGIANSMHTLLLSFHPLNQVYIAQYSAYMVRHVANIFKKKKYVQNFGAEISWEKTKEMGR
jgi:hypothetical protein